MNIKCLIFGHVEGRTYTVFKHTGQYLARCKRCSKMILYNEEEI